MIYIDDREGSKELEPLIAESMVVRLEYGDACITGWGPEGEVDVGIERKRIGDLVNSISTGRLSGHQVPGMLEMYYRSYLIVEGWWKENACDGELLVRRGKNWGKLDRGGRRFSAQGIWNYLNSIEMMGGVIVRQTRDIRDTAYLIKTIHTWWQKPWDGHSAHLQMHKQGPTTAGMGIKRPTLLRRIAAELPGIGWLRSISVEREFGTVENLMLANVDDLLRIEGIGKVTAKAVYEALHGPTD